MAERNKIAIIYQYNENWIGGTYYIENLIKALLTLAESRQPIVFAFTKTLEDYERLSANTGYPFLREGNVLRKLNIFSKVLNKVSFAINRSFLISPYRKDIPICFPSDINYPALPTAAQVYWIPDFQEHFLPSFFSSAEIQSRKATQEKTVKTGKYIVFSSRSAQADFNNIYPGNILQQFVIPFAVSHNDIEIKEDILAKYSLPPTFFICSNQFWKHKNHLLVLQAVNILVKKGQHPFVVFTGKEYDYRNGGYYEELVEYCKENELNRYVKFLGFISRNEQLWLMKQAVAVIQPSLFEGWSTVIEDAKSLNASILASDIEVNIEQLANYPNYAIFESGVPDALAESMEKITVKNSKLPFDYSTQVTAFANSFFEMTQCVKRH